MTLQEKCKDLTDRLEGHKIMDIKREKAKALEAVRQELVEIHDKLAHRVTRAVVCTNGGVLSWGKLPKLTMLIEKVQKVLENFRSDPSGITKGRTYTSLNTQAMGLNERFDSVLTKAWEDFFKLNVPAVDRKRLDSLVECGQFRQTIPEIKYLQEKLNKFKGVLPATREELNEFLTQSKALRDLHNELQGTDFPEDVLAFLRATDSPLGARLSLLTPSVVNWLREKDMLDTFRIRR